MSADEQEITAELSVQDLAPVDLPEREAPAVVLPLVFAAKTDLGRVRENNEDKFDWWEPEDPRLLANRGRLYCVADGMGGHAAGQIASEMALKAVGVTYYSAMNGAPDDALKRAIVQANTLVFDTARAVPSRKGMGCTIVAVAVLDDSAVVAWAGDGRVYRVRGGVAERVTEDHSWVAEQVKMGVLTEEDAERSPYKNIITRCLGPEPNVQPDVLRLNLAPGDALLLCSDGLTGVVADVEIGQTISTQSPSFACRSLIDLANERGGPDNITAAIVAVDGGSERPSATEPQPGPTDEPATGQPNEDPSPKRRRWFGR